MRKRTRAMARASKAKDSRAKANRAKASKAKASRSMGNRLTVKNKAAPLTKPAAAAAPDRVSRVYR